MSFSSDTPLQVSAYGINGALIHQSTFPAIGVNGGFIGFNAPQGIRRIELFANNGQPLEGAEGLYGIFYQPPDSEIALEHTVGTNPNECASTDAISVPPGTQVTWCYRITNQSAITYSYHHVTDTVHGAGAQEIRLAPGASLAFTRTDSVAASVTNNVTWAARVPLQYAPFLGICSIAPDITATGAPLTLTDDGLAPVTLPFRFPYADLFTSQLLVSNNGGVLLGTNTGVIGSENLPLPTAQFKHAILPYWDDLDTETGNVYHGLYTYNTLDGIAADDLLAPGGRVPAGGLNYYVIQWYDRPHYPGPPGPGASGATFTLGMILPGQGMDGYFFTCYADTDFGDPALNYGASATVGVNDYRYGGEQFSFNTAVFTGTGIPGMGWSNTPATQRYTATDSASVTIVNPNVSVMPAAIAATHNPAPQSSNHPLTIHNTGDAPLNWLLGETATNTCAIGADVPWLSVSDNSGSVPAGGNDVVTVNLNSAGLAAGTHSARLCLSSNDPDSPMVEIPVTLQVASAPTPTPTPTQPPDSGQRLYLPSVRRR